MQDPELGALGKAAVPAQAGGRSRPALPDVRGYTSPRGQAAGSTAGSFAARALLLLQEGSVGRGAAARPHPHAGHPLGKPWGSLAPRSETQRDTRAPQGCKKEHCSMHREAKAGLERVGEVLVSTCRGWGSGLCLGRAAGSWHGRAGHGAGMWCRAAQPRWWCQREAPGRTPDDNVPG